MMNGYCVLNKNSSKLSPNIKAWFMYETDARDWVSINSLSHSDDTDVRIEESNYEIKPNEYILITNGVLTTEV